jgi:hypothetical protein
MAAVATILIAVTALLLLIDLKVRGSRAQS